MANVRQDEVLTRACKCLNIRIHPRPPHGTPPDFLKDCAADSGYTLTYVGEEGLKVVSYISRAVRCYNLIFF
jgi:hypothetical protein